MQFVEAFTYGLLLGVATAISPGPFIALIIAEALDGKLKNAIIISFTPILTDIPIIFLSFSLLKNFLNKKEFLAVISFLGFIFLFYYGIYHTRTKRFSYIKATGKIEEPEDIISSLWKGFIVNLLSPYTYIFWVFIATSFLIKLDVLSRFVFIFSFFSGLIGSSILLAFLIYKGRIFLSSKYLVYITKILGIILILFGFRLLYEGLKYIGLI